LSSLIPAGVNVKQLASRAEAFLWWAVGETSRLHSFTRVVVRDTEPIHKPAHPNPIYDLGADWIRIFGQLVTAALKSPRLVDIRTMMSA